jgi:hypothetical protein
LLSSWAVTDCGHSLWATQHSLKASEHPAKVCATICIHFFASSTKDSIQAIEIAHFSQTKELALSSTILVWAKPSQNSNLLATARHGSSYNLERCSVWKCKNFQPEPPLCHSASAYVNFVICIKTTKVKTPLAIWGRI